MGYLEMLYNDNWSIARFALLTFEIQAEHFFNLLLWR